MVIYHRLNKIKLAPLVVVVLLLLLLPSSVGCRWAINSHVFLLLLLQNEEMNLVRNRQSDTQYLFVSQINREFHRAQIPFDRWTIFFFLILLGVRQQFLSRLFASIATK